MAWKFFNPNPCNLLVGDCTIRAAANTMNSTTTNFILSATFYISK